MKSADQKKMPLTTEIDLHFYFPFKAFPENERERESVRARERRSNERNLAFARSRRREIREEEFELCLSFFWVVACVFLDLCYPSSFPNTRKYFLENFLKCNQTHRNIFLFRKLAFPENMYFPENVLQQPNTALVSVMVSFSENREMQLIGFILLALEAMWH